MLVTMTTRSECDKNRPTQFHNLRIQGDIPATKRETNITMVTLCPWMSITRATRFYRPLIPQTIIIDTASIAIRWDLIRSTKGMTVTSRSHLTIWEAEWTREPLLLKWTVEVTTFNSRDQITGSLIFPFNAFSCFFLPNWLSGGELNRNEVSGLYINAGEIGHQGSIRNDIET